MIYVPFKIDVSSGMYEKIFPEESHYVFLKNKIVIFVIAGVKRTFPPEKSSRVDKSFTPKSRKKLFVSLVSFFWPLNGNTFLQQITFSP